MKTKNLIFRIFFIILLLFPLVYLQDFAYHFYVYLTSTIITGVIMGQWHIVLICIILSIAFLIPLSFRRKANWLEYGIVTAFFISLFVEMYGIPLTILLTSNYFFLPGTILPPNIFEFNFLGVGFGMDISMTYGAVLIVLGMFLIILGWLTLYMNMRKVSMVTTGIYAYSRHPQYLGFILIILGWLYGWPTIITLIFVPILLYQYMKVCRIEENEILENMPEYEKYKENTPFFF